ncbi:NADPH-dependent FMN reductase [Undibacterium curvum]|uniref:NADPH-dependent FMN reductase n=1 Tax=Undibacterium curvum TaxID=2762294 RepID=UPI003D0DE8F1
MSVLLLSGSPVTPSRSARLLDYVGERLNAYGQRTVSVPIRELPVQALFNADFSDPELLAARQLLAKAEAVVIATPIYKASYCGLLKSFLDVLPQDGLAGKVVLPIATAGTQSHMLALDYSLRPMLASLSARYILPGIYATDAQIQWHETEGLQIDPAIAEHVHNGVELLHDALESMRQYQLSRPATRSAAAAELRCRA